MIALALRYWWAVALVLVGALLGVQTVRLSAAETDMAQHLAADADARAAAERSARDEETRRQALYDEEAARGRTEKIERERAVADLADTADGLRGTVEQYRRRLAAAGTCTAIGGSGKPSDAPRDLLADLYLGLVRAAQDTSKFADDTHGAGSACERLGTSK